MVRTWIRLTCEQIEPPLGRTVHYYSREALLDGIRLALDEEWDRLTVEREPETDQ